MDAPLPALQFTPEKKVARRIMALQLRLAHGVMVVQLHHSRGVTSWDRSRCMI
ncbi:hypothetical protein NSPZN2_10159 [Nitrospira defluvii]|uniref:Transposase n=1 Tax=Nitrospira defluvii TaxID=330214 RepID=A0ABM8QCF6_9BACT|nr:hypothetical protein NSPZN2_10159 [Nitrospira defluvii]